MQDEKPQKITCPTCNGEKVLRGFAGLIWDKNTGEQRLQQTQIICVICNGDGVITQEQQDRINTGLQIKKERMHQGETLRQAAKRIGISSAELSAIENGRKINAH